MCYKLQLGACQPFGNVYLNYNCISHVSLIVYANADVYPVADQPLVLERCFESREVCDMIYMACLWFVKYMEVHEWRPVYEIALNYLDKVACEYVHRNSEEDRVMNIIYLKKILACDPRGVYMPQTSEMLVNMLNAEALHRLMTRKAKLIQGVWREVVADPYHIVCQKRLMREWDELGNNCQNCTAIPLSC